MNGYLLFSTHNLDDIPLQFFRTKRDALAARPWPEAKDNPLGTWDQSGFIGHKLLQFKKGLPVGTAEFYPAEEMELQSEPTN